jgi:UDP-glucose:(heptosyl)LPS alpha-1,3-glucosyltransferase
MISRMQESLYRQHYGTHGSRIHFVPPNVAGDRLAGAESDGIRWDLRQALGVGPDERFVLQLGSDFRRKGLDRSIVALSHLPDALLTKTRLYVVGRDREGPYARMAKRLGVAGRVVFLGARDDVPRILLGADLLVHPAYHENTGTVLVEALASGLPVIATGVCGYAHYIEDADAGWVIPEPFEQNRFNHTLQAALERADLREVGRRGVRFAREEDLYGMVDAAVKTIEKVASTDARR